jgi:thiamine biosynthesis lipoprotein
MKFGVWRLKFFLSFELLALSFLFLSGCATPGKNLALHRQEFTQPQMGLPFRIVLYAPDETTGTMAARDAFARIRELNDALSDYDPDSELSRLSRTAGTGRAIEVSRDLWRMLERAQEFARRSDGAFDVTVGPCVNLWRQARRDKQLPKPESLEAARAAVGWRHLRLDARRRTATLLRPGMRLDLGGIAKGYAVDEALAALRSRGVTRALVAGGGDMAAGDAPPGTRGWRIEIAPLDVTNGPPARFVLLQNAALATSGDFFQRLEIGGQRYSHIVDPRTGVGLTDHSLVTVIARDCTTADALATAVSVLGLERGAKLAGKTPGASTRIVRAPGNKVEALESPGFARRYDTQ